MSLSKESLTINVFVLTGTILRSGSTKEVKAKL